MPWNARQSVPKIGAWRYLVVSHPMPTSPDWTLHLVGLLTEAAVTAMLAGVLVQAIVERLQLADRIRFLLDRSVAG